MAELIFDEIPDFEKIDTSALTYLTAEERIEIDEKTLAYYGYTHQMLKALEELGEASQQMAKAAAGEGDADKLSEELADALNTMESVIHHFHIEERVDFWRDYKARRTLSRLLDDQSKHWEDAE